MLNPTQTPTQVIDHKYSARMYCYELRTVVLDTKGIGVAQGSSLDSIQQSGPERALSLKSAATNTQGIDNNIHLEFHELENILLNANGVAGDGT